MQRNCAGKKREYNKQKYEKMKTATRGMRLEIPNKGNLGQALRRKKQLSKGHFEAKKCIGVTKLKRELKRKEAKI